MTNNIQAINHAAIEVSESAWGDKDVMLTNRFTKHKSNVTNNEILPGIMS